MQSKQHNRNDLYAGLDIETRIVVQQRTGEIRTLMQRTAQDLVEIGQKLVEVKARLGHGLFGAWLQAEFEWSERTAQRYMSVAQAFKSDTVSVLANAEAKALYLLAAPSTPESVREEAVQRAETGERLTYSAAREMVRGAQAGWRQEYVFCTPAAVQARDQSRVACQGRPIPLSRRHRATMATSGTPRPSTLRQRGR